MNPKAIMDAKLADAGIVELDTMSREERVAIVLSSIAVIEAARNVVAQWQGDLSRKPHIGRLRDAIAAFDACSTSAVPK